MTWAMLYRDKKNYITALIQLDRDLVENYAEERKYPDIWLYSSSLKLDFKI
ncbi:hypothetical protein LCGC14_2280720, partial [marine sediment metagenome]